VDSLEHRWMFTHLAALEFSEVPERLVDPRFPGRGARYLARFFSHAKNATVCSPALGASWASLRTGIMGQMKAR
jgi:hypothetical protein